ncbi:MAG: MFS transporter [Rudaea sp.]
MDAVQKHLRRNFTLGVVNGALFGFVDSITAPALVLALFVSQLGGSNFMIGLLPALYNGGWYLPQLFVAHRLDRAPLKKPMYVWTGALRILCWVAIVLVTLLLSNDNPALLLLLFFIPYVAYCFLSGLGGNAFMTIVAKTIPSRRRGSFFGLRDLTGMMAGILAGFLISIALDPKNGLAFPHNFALLFILTLIAVTVGLSIFVFVVEPREVTDGREMSFMSQMHAARRLWHDNHRFRSYLSTRILLALSDIATPFYAIYAIRQLGAPESAAGLYIGLTTFSAMLSNPGWSWISDHRGTAPVMLAAAAGWLLMPVIAFSFMFAGGSTLLVAPFGLVFVIYGAARTAANISFPTYLLEIAPVSERSLYIGLTNTTLGVATFIPAVGGILLDLFGFSPLFILSFLIAAAGLLAARALARPGRVAEVVPGISGD